MKKYHFYSFAFSHEENSLKTVASVYIGYKKKFISIDRIKDAKEQAKIHPGAVMLSCCYLGKMPKNYMIQGITSRFTLTGKAGAFWNKLKLLVGFSGK